MVWCGSTDNGAMEPVTVPLSVCVQRSRIEAFVVGPHVVDDSIGAGVMAPSLAKSRPIFAEASFSL